jgi:hypothetical protein
MFLFGVNQVKPLNLFDNLFFKIVDVHAWAIAPDYFHMNIYIHICWSVIEIQF